MFGKLNLGATGTKQTIDLGHIWVEGTLEAHLSSTAPETHFAVDTDAREGKTITCQMREMISS